MAQLKDVIVDLYENGFCYSQTDVWISMIETMQPSDIVYN